MIGCLHNNNDKKRRREGMKIRVYKDIEANDVEEAMEKMDGILLEDEAAVDVFNFQENPLDRDDEMAVLEIARVALADGEIFDHVAEELDMSDEEMQKLRDRIIKITDQE